MSIIKGKFDKVNSLHSEKKNSCFVKKWRFYSESEKLFSNYCNLFKKNSLQEFFTKNLIFVKR